MSQRLALFVSLVLLPPVHSTVAQTLPPLNSDPFAGVEQAAVQPIETTVPPSDDGAAALISCNDCGHPAAACACQQASADSTSDDAPTPPSMPLSSEPLPASLVVGQSEQTIGQAACQFSNLFWCNPYGAVYLDPCQRGDCIDCNSHDAPIWYASVELIALMRDQTDDLAFQRLGQAGDVVLETGDFETELDAGAKLTGGVALTDLYRLETSYLGSFEWSDRAAVRNFDPNGTGSVGNLFGPFSNFGTPTPQIGTDLNTFASINMAAKFNSLELNVRRRLIIPISPQQSSSRLCVANSVLLGLRHLNLDERFGYVSSSTVPAGGTVNRADIATENSMIGLQIGLLSQFLVRHGQGWVDLEIKGGIYQNELSVRSEFESTDLAGTTFSQFTGVDEKDRTAFLGELSLVYNHQLFRNLSCRIGYNAFWLSGVALGSQNLSTDINLLALGPTVADHDGDLILHGPTFGMTWAY